MSKSLTKVSRKFLPNEVPFKDTFIFTESRRFSKILEMYTPNHSTNENGTHVLEWKINCSVTELTTTAKMYYQRYNITTK
jgi:hypothetical protein